MKVLASTDHLTTTTASEVEERRRAQPRVLRVLHVVNRFDTGGTEYGVLKVMDGLGSDSFEHRLCATRGFDSGLARQHGLDMQVSVVGRLDVNFQFLLFRLMRIMKAFKPDIVHSRNWGAIEAIPAARLAGVPVAIHSEHGYELDMLDGLPLRRRLLRRAVYGMADAVFTVTRELRSYHEYQARVAAGRIRVIRNGVDTARFAPRPERRFEIREKFNLSENSFVIGTVGRMVEIKDHATLLKAAEILIGRGVDVRVLLAGAGSELAALQRLVHASSDLAGRVTFLGARDDIPDVLNALDVFVLSSISEGMSNTLLEAMASGLSVVATRVGGNPELVEEDLSGWLFAPGDVADLAHRLERLARQSELRLLLGAAARQRTIAEFSLDRMISDYRNLYRELAGRRGLLVGSKA